jgi:type I restriction enzyme, S subunit
MIRAGYLLTTLTHPTLGRPILIRIAYGASIPHLDPGDVSDFPVVRLTSSEEDVIADLTEESAAERARADVLERELAVDAGNLIDRFIAGDLASFLTVLATEENRL